MRWAQDQVLAGGWPRGMQIQMDTHAQPVLWLLFLREAWGVGRGLPLPQLEEAPDTGFSSLPRGLPDQLVEERWLRTWLAAFSALAGEPCQPPGTGHVQRPVPAAAHSGFYVLQYGADGLDLRAFECWDQGFEARRQRSAAASELHERLVEPVVVAAWERGLRKIVVLPWASHGWHRLSAGSLVVSWRTWEDAELLRQALAAWIRTPFSQMGH